MGVFLSSLLFFLMCTNSSVSAVYASNQCENLSFAKKENCEFCEMGGKTVECLTEQYVFFNDTCEFFRLDDLYDDIELVGPASIQNYNIDGKDVKLKDFKLLKNLHSNIIMLMLVILVRKQLLSF